MAKKPKSYDSSQWYGPAGKNMSAKLPKEGMWEESMVESTIIKVLDKMADILGEQIAEDMNEMFPYPTSSLLPAIPEPPFPLPTPTSFKGVVDKLPDVMGFVPGDFVTLIEPHSVPRDFVIGHNGNWYLWTDPPLIKKEWNDPVELQSDPEKSYDIEQVKKIMKYAEAYGDKDISKSSTFDSVVKLDDFLAGMAILHYPNIFFKSDYDHSKKMFSVMVYMINPPKKASMVFPKEIATETVVAKWANSIISELEANEGTKMALLLKGFNGFTTMKKVGVPATLFDWFSKVGTAEYVNGEVMLTVGSVVMFGNAFSLGVPMTIAHVQQANTGTLPTHVKASYQEKFKYALATLKHKFDFAVEKSADPTQSAEPALYGLPKIPTAEKKEVEELYLELHSGIVVNNNSSYPEHSDKAGLTPSWGIEKSSKLHSGGPSLQQLKKELGPHNWLKNSETESKIEVVVSVGWPSFALDELKSAELVKLSCADRMYQPVQATTGGKRYYVVALSKLFRVAAKYGQGEMSVRIEWTPDAGLDDINFMIKSVFPNAGAGHGYGSLHLAIPDDALAAKTLGAVLMGCGVAWETPLPNIQVIKGK